MKLLTILLCLMVLLLSFLKHKELSNKSNFMESEFEKRSEEEVIVEYESQSWWTTYEAMNEKDMDLVEYSQRTEEEEYERSKNSIWASDKPLF